MQGKQNGSDKTSHIGTKIVSNDSCKKIFFFSVNEKTIFTYLYYVLAS